MARPPKEPDHLHEIRETKQRERTRSRELKKRRRYDDDFGGWDDGWDDGFDVYLIDILRSRRRHEDD